MADILIRGMEMPDGCHHCRFSYLYEGETNDGEPCTVIMCSAMEQGTNGAEYDGNRPFWCPLVPLPEGHGRLIDADELAEDLQLDVENDQRALDDLNIVGVNRERIQFDKDCKQNCMWYLSECPTIIPAEGGINL